MSASVKLRDKAFERAQVVADVLEEAGFYIVTRPLRQTRGAHTNEVWTRAASSSAMLDEALIVVNDDGRIGVFSDYYPSLEIRTRAAFKKAGLGEWFDEMMQ
jgi:hypothetical protein